MLQWNHQASTLHDLRLAGWVGWLPWMVGLFNRTSLKRRTDGRTDGWEVRGSMDGCEFRIFTRRIEELIEGAYTIGTQGNQEPQCHARYMMPHC